MLVWLTSNVFILVVDSMIDILFLIIVFVCPHVAVYLGVLLNVMNYHNTSAIFIHIHFTLLAFTTELNYCKRF